MGNTLRFDDRVAIVTGSGGGLGRTHALLLASRGAKVVVNDLGGSATGGGKNSEAADRVVEEIRAAGGTAVANYDSVVEGDKIVKTAMDEFGRVDILINNAGILRDTSFQKMSDEDWELIYRVHVQGSYKTTKAVWDIMRDQRYGRIIMTASAAGIYGNFGQANYSMAKLGLLGFSNTLAIEGHRRDIHVNTIAPLAGSRLTETVLPKDVCDQLKPEFVSPLVAWLCHEGCEETGGLFEVGGGFYAKLRWERAAGKTFRIGRDVTVEAVKKSWGDIIGFDKTEHPTNIASSMQPVMVNLEKGPSLGGNQYIDVDQALGFEFPEQRSSYDQRDVALYALGVGAGSAPLDPSDLQLVYEMHGDGFKTLPTFGVIPALNMIMTLAKKGEIAPGLNYGLDRILHGEQYTEVIRPLPAKAELRHKIKIKDIWDKGKGAVVVTEIISSDADGDELIKNELTMFVRGAGGWGGARGPSADVNVPPERAPDATVSEKIGEGQALLYRLSGDWNPLHADPGFAKAFGYDRPILHGLCSFGFAARHVIQQYCGGDPRFFKSIKVRFADNVFPGETLVTEMWKESDTRILFQCKVEGRDSVVIKSAAIELYPEIPKPKPKKQKKAAAASAAPATPTSADVFAAVARYIEENSDMVKSVGKSFLFNLSAPDSSWLVDVKTGAGSVTQGKGKADCTLALSDSDFMDMCAGKADPMKLFNSGSLKISGDLMASQKLMFLQKVPPQYALDALAKRGGSGAGAASAPAAVEKPTSGMAFIGLQVWVERHPELAEKIQKIFQFKLSDPDSAWTIDLKNGKGSVEPGVGANPDCTLELSDQDFMDMSAGKADPMKLFSSGALKISGDIMASQKLGFLQKIKPEEIKDEVLARLSGGAAAAAAVDATPARELAAPKVFATLAERLAENGGLVDEVQAVVQFKVTDPEAAWTLDLATAPGSIVEGTHAEPTTTLTLSDEDLGLLTKNEIGMQSLFQRGRVVIDGDISVATRLGFMTKLG